MDRDLRAKIQKKGAQTETGETVHSLERETQEIRSQLDQKQDELRHLEETAAPRAFFSVERHLRPNGGHPAAEEQPITVSVKIVNLGRHGVTLQYEEGLPEGLVLSEGTLNHDKLIGPRASDTFSYVCYGICPGKYQIFTKRIEYEGRSALWDQIEETEVEIRSGTEPFVFAARHYRYEEEGLTLLVQLENRGDKIAHDVSYQEKISIEGQSDPIVVSFEGDISSGQQQTIEARLPVRDPAKVHFAEPTRVTYTNRQKQPTELTLDPIWKRLEYTFPRTPADIPIVGRKPEMELLSERMAQVWQVSHGQPVLGLKRLLLIEGIEGIGKTRLLHELLTEAQGRGFRCVVEDAKNRSPVRRMLRQLLNLMPDEDNAGVIWERLKAELPGEERNLQRDTIFRFISPSIDRFEPDELDSLAANALVLLKTLCRSAPTVLAFENIHWTPEGVEEQLLVRLFRNSLTSSDERILLCATYRPAQAGHLPVIGKLRISSERYETVKLGPIAEDGTRALVDTIVSFPRLSEPLHCFVREWSHGNPLYIIELLRLLVHPDSKYIVRIGSEWCPSADSRLENLIPKTIEEVILRRVEEELPKETGDLIKVLSAIGLDLPLTLIRDLAATEFPQWSEKEMTRQIDELCEAGLLVAARQDRPGGEDYEFEHQLKQEVLYESLPEATRQQLEKQVAVVLLTKRIFLDPEKQIRHLARHIIHSPRDFQLANLARIRKAAKLERDLHNFSASLAFYKAALSLIPEKSLESVELLLERSRLYQLRGDWLPADRDLDRALELFLPGPSFDKRIYKQARRLRILLAKERGQVMLRQPQASLKQASELLRQAKKSMEGLLRIRRFFPPKEQEFYRDLVEIYLALAELCLRQRHFWTCRRACRRAEALAQTAKKTLHDDSSLLPSVYLSLGNLYSQQGRPQEARKQYHQALKGAGTDLYVQGRVWVALADVSRALGDSDQARCEYEKAISLQQQLEDLQGLAMSFGGIGQLLVEGQAFELGQYYCEQAHKYQKLIGGIDLFWRSCVSLVKIHRSRGAFEEAGGYLLEARNVLFDQHHFSRLSLKEQTEIYDLLSVFADYFGKAGKWEESRALRKDQEYAEPTAKWDPQEQTSVKMSLGEANYKTRRFNEAIDDFNQVVGLAKLPGVRAEAHEWLGHIYADFQVPHGRPNPDGEHEQVQDEVEYHYEEAVKQFASANLVRRAVSVYEKLLIRIVTDESGLLQLLPFTFLRIIRELPLDQRIHDQFVEKAIEVLVRNELRLEAGDILVYTARELAKVDDGSIPFESKRGYLRRAEDFYRQGKPEDLIWGLNMVLPTYLRLGLWDELLRCIEELFRLNIDIEDVDEFIASFQALAVFEDRMDAEQLKHFASLALRGPEQIAFSTQQQIKLFLYAAKVYSHIADKVDEAEEKSRSEDLSLELYERVRRMSPPDAPVLATVLNDSSLIYSRRGKDTEALEHLDEAIRVAEHYSGQGGGGSRHNRALLYLKLGRFDEAKADFELALDDKLRDLNDWIERLENQDERPLGPTEISQMRHCKRTLAITRTSFAESLLFSDSPRAQELALDAARLFKEINDPDNGKMAEEMATLAAALMTGGTSIQELVIEATRLLQEDNGSDAAAGVQVFAKLAGLLSGKGSIRDFLEVLLQRLHPCPACKGLLARGKDRCHNCGSRVCPECGVAVEEDATECPNVNYHFTTNPDLS